MFIPYDRLQTVVREQSYPLLFATISGAHLYGFPSPDSDYDLRGVHMLPVEEMLGLIPAQETIECSRNQPDLELDLVTHDLRKFLGLMLKRNGYVLEQLYSPLVVHAAPEHAELKELGKGCVTRHHAHHYLGFTATQWKLFAKENPPRVKPLLYVYRVLLTGIHLMRTGQVQANLAELNRDFKLSHVDDLIALKQAGQEKSKVTRIDLAFHENERMRLEGILRLESERSPLPEKPTNVDAINDFLIRVRMNYGMTMQK